MVRCSKCGSEVKNLIKTWTVTLGKERKVKITFGSFTCEKCSRKFKALIKKEPVIDVYQKSEPFPPPSVKMIV